MKELRNVSRRSFLATVAGAAIGGTFLNATGHAAAAQGCTDRDPAPPRGDPGGRGRNCASQPQTGCSDRDPADPSGRGRNCTAQPHTGCSDRDPSDPGGRGRTCGGTTGGGDAYVTGRRERRYEVCWVDHPSRSNDECNMQTYSEWATTYSDGRVVYDTSEADAGKASMTSRGYTARWHRILQNW